VLPYFKRSESYRELFRPAIAVSDDRGVDGPIQVGTLNDDDPVLKTLLDTASRAFHVRVQHDYNTRAGIEGVAPMQRNLGHDIDRPRRSSPYTGYVQPHLATRPNLHVVDMATVTRIHFDHSGHRAEAVEYLRKGDTHRAIAAREIVLSAGAINSPKILLQSGVGHAQDLDPLGVAPVVEVRGVGRNLHDHIFLPFVYRTNPQVIPPRNAESPVLIGFFKSPRSRWVDLEFACCVLPGGLLVGFLISLRNDAFGRVRLTSSDPLAPPYIEYGFDPKSPDMDTMMEACRTIRRWLFDSKLVTAEIEPGITSVPMDADEAQWQAWFATAMKGIYHMAGTCKMGPPEDPMSVVDNQLRLRGVPNLRIADCSIMPRVVASHPSASAVMIGEKLADMVMS
jgi:choline dehydrogenase